MELKTLMLMSDLSFKVEFELDFFFGLICDTVENAIVMAAVKVKLIPTEKAWWKIVNFLIIFLSIRNYFLRILHKPHQSFC